MADFYFSFNSSSDVYECSKYLSEKLGNNITSHVYSNGNYKELFVECDESSIDFMLWSVSKKFDVSLNESAAMDNSAIFDSRAYKRLDQRTKKAVDKAIAYWEKLGDSKLETAMRKASADSKVPFTDIEEFFVKIFYYEEDVKNLIWEKEEDKHEADREKKREEKKSDKENKKKESDTKKEKANSEKDKDKEGGMMPPQIGNDSTFKNFDVGGKEKKPTTKYDYPKKEKLEKPIKGSPIDKDIDLQITPASSV